MSEKITLSQARQKALDSCKKRPAVDDKDDYCCNCVELQAELDDYHNAEKFVADPPHDEICCGCVGILRKQLKDVQTELEEYKAVIDEIYDKTIEGYIIEMIDVLRGEAVWGEDGTADYSQKKSEVKILNNDVKIEADKLPKFKDIIGLFAEGEDDNG